MLYDIIPHVPHMSNDPTIVTPSANVGSTDGIIGSVSKQKLGKQSNIQKTMPTLTIQTQNSYSPSDNDPYEVNVIQSVDSNKPSDGNKKKGKGKQKQSNAKYGKNFFSLPTSL